MRACWSNCLFRSDISKWLGKTKVWAMYETLKARTQARKIKVIIPVTFSFSVCGGGALFAMQMNQDAFLQPTAALFFCFYFPCQFSMHGRTHRSTNAQQVLSGCQHTKLRNMITKRHNTASVLIVQALQRNHAVPTKLPTTLTQAAQINYQSKAQI